MSSSRGASETLQLKSNIENQLNRLLTQLDDLEVMRDELDAEEYESTRKETLDQMREFENYLGKLLSGDMSLVDQFGSVQLAIQAAIRDAFKSPDVVRMFAKKENKGLRSKLGSLEEDLKLGRIKQKDFDDLSGEIVIALEILGEELTSREKDLLQKRTKNMSSYVNASEEVDGKITSTAATEIKKATK